MMERTDRHFRYFLRLISRRVLLYTEMLTSAALVRGDHDYFLEFHPFEHPVAVQLGGSDPAELAAAAKIAADYGYDEINLNIGCPSGRVQKGRIGACLMADPERVADCVRAMRETTHVPVSVKTRIGIDEQDSYEFLAAFVDKVSRASCRKIIIHARKALLKGLSPKQNRNIPPLDYDRVLRLKQDYPDLEIVLNGGITNLDQAGRFLAQVDGVMIGREVYNNPFILASADRRFYGEAHAERTRDQVLRDYLPYIQAHLDRGIHLNQITRHLSGLFHGCPRSKEWRRKINEIARRRPCDAGSVMDALAGSDCV